MHAGTWSHTRSTASFLPCSHLEMLSRPYLLRAHQALRGPGPSPAVITWASVTHSALACTRAAVCWRGSNTHCGHTCRQTSSTLTRVDCTGGTDRHTYSPCTRQQVGTHCTCGTHVCILHTDMHEADTHCTHETYYMHTAYWGIAACAHAGCTGMHMCVHAASLTCTQGCPVHM